MDKFTSETKSINSQKNKDFKNESKSRRTSKTVILKHNDIHILRSKLNIHKTINPLKFKDFEKIFPMTEKNFSGLNQEYLKSIENEMKTKINDMKLLHVESIKKRRRVIFQDSNKQANISKNTKNIPETKIDKENKEITKEEKK